MRLYRGTHLAPGHMKRAIDYMQAHLAKPMSLADIAAAAGTSARTLQDSFQRFRQTTPMAFLRDLRMEAVRQDLLDPANQAPIAEIALRWGFVHMGMFAARYRQRYGERPSDTRLRRH